MLKPESIERIFSTARSKGLSCTELYLEKTQTDSVFFLGKHHKSLKSEASGASLTCESLHGTKHFSVSEIAEEAILEALGETKTNSVEQKEKNLLLQKQVSKKDRLLALARKIESISPQFSFEYSQTQRDFAIINSKGEVLSSKDEKAHFNYRIQKDSQSFQFFENQTSIDSFWQNSFQENLLIEESKTRLESPSLWPVPCGEVPLLFSHRALAKILFTLQKGFEADNLVNNQSFLNFLEDPLPFAFSLLEVAAPDQRDQEGEHTQSLELFNNGDFKGFATNKRLADALSLPKSGHGRRMSYREAPTISLYHSKLIPNENLWLNLPTLQKAILIEEIEFLQYDPTTTKAKISFPHSKLIHHGSFGEKLEPWSWEISLLEILKSLRQFSKDSILHGFENKKGKSSLPSQITCPDALLEGLPLPGTVPQEYYWEN